MFFYRGDGLIKQLSRVLRVDFLAIKGFLERNVKYVRQWFLFYKQKDTIGQQLVAQLENDIHKPIGVSKYQLTHALPDNLKPSLPGIEELERKLAELGGNNDE